MSNEGASMQKKQRLLVMNGHCLVQSEQGDKWMTDKVEKAKSLKPGLYNIYLATPADKSKTHDGLILRADQDHVYQQVAKVFIRHERADFEAVPDVGCQASIQYANGRAVAAPLSAKLRQVLA